MENYALRRIYGKRQRTRYRMVYVYCTDFETTELYGLSGSYRYFLYVVKAVFAQFVIHERERKLGAYNGNFKLL